MLAARKELQTNLNSFDPWNHILDRSSEAYSRASGGKGRINILDSKFHFRADNDTDYLLSSIFYSIAIYIGKKKGDKNDLAKYTKRIKQNQKLMLKSQRQMRSRRWPGPLRRRRGSAALVRRAGHWYTD